MGKRVETKKSDLKKLYKSGQTITQIAVTYGVTYGTMHKHFVDHNIKRRECGYVLKELFNRKLTESQIRRDYTKNGLSIETVANKHGVSVDTVTRRMKRYGIPVVKKNVEYHINKRSLNMDYHTHRLRVPDIAEKYDVCTSVIYRELDRHNLGRRNRPRKTVKF